MEKEILEGNKLIAEFDGWEISQDQEQIYLHSGSNKVINRLIGFDDCVYLDDAHYHSSWDWLMPAWSNFCDKALKMFPDLKEKTGFEKEVRFYVVQKGRFEKTVHSNDCIQAFNILAESIKWYNSNK